MAGNHSLTVRRETLREQAGLPGDDPLRSAHLNPASSGDCSLELRPQIGRQTNGDPVAQGQRLNFTLRSIDDRADTAVVSSGRACR